MMASYRRLLREVDAWYKSVRSRHPDKVPCTRGCRDCCLGLFDVSIADRELLREGLQKVDAATHADIEQRSTDIMRELRARFPTLGTTLAGLDEKTIDAICDALGDIPCPVLGSEGECRLYAHRPLTCRLAGVPVVDFSGEIIAASGCSQCTLTAKETSRLDCHRITQQEKKCLEAIDPEKAEVSLLIPQALERPPHE